MNTRSSLTCWNRHLYTGLVFVLVLCCVSGCKKSAASDKSVDPQDLLRPDQVALLERGPATPGMDSLDQLIPPGSRMVMMVDMRPFQESGLAGRIMEAIPADALGDYNEWLRDTGFNPIEQSIGGAMWSDATDTDDFASPGSNARGVMILKNAPVLDLLYKLSEADDDDDDDDDLMEYDLAIYCPMDEATLAGVADLIDEDKTLLSHTHFGDSVHLGLFRVREHGAYIYAWPGGILFGISHLGDEDNPATTATERLYSFARGLDNAAQAGGPEEDRGELPALFVHLPIDGDEATIAANVSDDVELTAVYPYATVGDRSTWVNAERNIRRLRRQADELSWKIVRDQDLPRRTQPLIEAVIENLDVDAGSDRVRFDVSLNTRRVSRMLGVL